MKHEWHTGKSDDLVETIIKVERQKKKVKSRRMHERVAIKQVNVGKRGSERE